MSKIKIVKDERTIKGDVDEKISKKFGKSSHLIISKKHIGKYINIIYPENSDYGILLDKSNWNKMISIIREYIEEHEGKHKVHKLQSLDEIKSGRFKIEELQRFLPILKKKDIKLYRKIKDIYGLK